MKYSLSSILFSFVFASLSLAKDSPRSVDAQMAQDHAELQTLLSNPAPREEVEQVLAMVEGEHGRTSLGLLFGVKYDLQQVKKNAPIPQTGIEAITAFNELLRERGITLLVVPVPSAVTSYTHQLSPSLTADQDLLPNYTNSLLALNEAGVQVVDLRAAFAASDLKRPVHHAADHHWASPGMEITAKELATRIMLLPEINKLPRDPALWKKSDKQIPSHTSAFHRNELYSNRNPDKFRFSTVEAVREWAGLPETETVVAVTYTGKKRLAGHRQNGPSARKDFNHPVVVIGDSNGHHIAKAHSGSGITNHLSAELGFLVPFATHMGSATGIAQSFIDTYLEKSPNIKVVIWVGRIKDFNGGGWRKIRVPGESEVEKALPANFAKPVRVQLDEVAHIPDPNDVVYKVALLAGSATVLTGPHTGSKLKLITPAILDRKRVPDAKKWKNGALLSLSPRSWQAEQIQHPTLSGLMLLDDVEDLTLPEHWVDSR